nr:glutaredoxin family protein [Andreprevotia lacus]
MSEADLKPDPSTVTLYTTTWCGYCRKARAYLNEHKIPFQDINIETPTGAQQMLAVSSDGKGVPLLVWKNSRKRGFSTQTYDALFAKAN